MGKLKNTQKEYKIFEIIRKMPELYNKQPGEEYDPEKSEVLKWLASPEVLICLFATARNKKIIAFDHDTKKWHGVKKGEERKSKPNQNWQKSIEKSNSKKRKQAQHELEIAFNRLSLENNAVTVNQIADFLDISNQAVYGRVKENGSLTAKKGIVIRKR